MLTLSFIRSALHRIKTQNTTTLILHFHMSIFKMWNYNFIHLYVHNKEKWEHSPGEESMTKNNVFRPTLDWFADKLPLPKEAFFSYCRLSNTTPQCSHTWYSTNNKNINIKTCLHICTAQCLCSALISTPKNIHLQLSFLFLLFKFAVFSSYLPY